MIQLYMEGENMKIERVVTGYLQENCYILTKDDNCLVIDPGDDYHLIKEKIDNKKVLAVLLTHNHFDHIGAVDDVKKEYNAEVYSYSNLKEGNNNINDFSFETIYTPGHTSDSICFYFYKEKLMFTGDFLFKESIGRWDLETGNYSDMKNSINKIKKYSDDIIIYPGHGEESTLFYEKNNNQYLFTN